MIRRATAPRPVVKNRKIGLESLLRFGKKVSFPAILAIPIIGGALAVSWSAAETAQALVDTPAGASAIPVAGSESAPAAVQSAPAAVQKMKDEAEDATIEPTERSEERRGGKECGSTGRSRWSPDH